MSNNNPDVILEKINTTFTGEIENFKIERLSKKDIKRAARTECFEGFIRKKCYTDKTRLNHYKQLSKLIRDTTIRMTDIFSIISDTKDSNTFIDHCWTIPIIKVENKKTLWTYNLNCVTTFEKIEDLRHWYELYLANLDKQTENKIIQIKFRREDYVRIVLEYFDKMTSL